MKREWIKWTTAFFLLVSSASAGRYERVVVFGESSSDVGNQWAATDELYPPSPPYFEGRWSNGPIWIDLVSARLGLGYSEPSARGGTNYSWGGTRSGAGEAVSNCSDLGLTMCYDLAGPNYGTQIDDFLSSSPTITADDLFVIWGGGNDMFAEIDPAITAENLAGHVMTLLEHGATDVVFLNMYNGVGNSATLNRQLTPRLETVRQQHPEATIVEVDIPTMTSTFWNSSDRWGITDVDTPALNTATLEVAEDPDAYLSWDGVHVTSAFNKVIADFVLRTMDPVLIRQGDFDWHGALTTEDADSLGAAIRDPGVDLQYDLNFDRTVNTADLRLWVTDYRRTYFGDANLDGEFNNLDIVSLLQAGEYLDGVDQNSTWGTGDWNADGEFDPADLILALQDGGYGQGPCAALTAVPEPTAIVLAAMGFLGLLVIGWHRPGRRHTAS